MTPNPNIIRKVVLPGGATGPFNTLSTIFDGVDEYGQCDDLQASLQAFSVGTVSMWIRPADATPSGIQAFWMVGDASTNTSLAMDIDTSGRLRGVVVANGSVRWLLRTDASPFTDNTWTHIALVQDGVSPVLYADGVAVAQTFTTSTNKTIWTNASEFDLGRIAKFENSALDGRNFNGGIDEMRFWSTNLSAANITTHYNGGSPLPPASEPVQGNLVTSYRMGDGDTFPTLTDNSGSDNATLVNMEAGDFVAVTP